MKRALKSVCYATLLVLAFTAGYQVSKFRFCPSTFSLDEAQVEQDVKSFSDLVADIQSYVKEHRGWLPDDMYRALLETGKVRVFEDFKIDEEFVCFTSVPIPVRIHEDMSLNPRVRFMTLWYPSKQEIWVMYLDGSWRREAVGWRNLIAPSDGLAATFDWERRVKSAGYPVPFAMGERSDWIKANGPSLVWDSAVKMYILPPQKQTTNPTTPQ